MKINLLLPSLGSSGGIDVAYKYVDLLAKDGHDVIVYKQICADNMHRYKCTAKNKIHQLYCTIKGLNLKRKSSNPVDKFVFKLNNYTVRDADVIIATAWPTAYSIAKLSNSKGRKVYFVQGFEIWDNDEYVKNSYKLPLDKIVISSWINQQLKAELNIGPFPVVYNGINNLFFNCTWKPRDDKEITFLMLNHTLPKKGVNNGLKIFEAIRAKYGNCKFRMFGMCGRRNLPKYVEYYQNPTKDVLVNLYSKSEIFVFPSLEEGWGLTPIEAMACGCIVVGTKTGFVLDLGEHGKNMLISEPGDIDKMIENIDLLINNVDLREKIRSNAYETIQALSWTKSYEKLLFLLKCGRS